MSRIKLSKHKYRQLCEYVASRDVDESDYPKCLQCGSNQNHTPHHVIFKSHGGNDSPDNLIQVCLDCHTKIHRYETELKPAIHKMLEGEPLYL